MNNEIIDLCESDSDSNAANSEQHLGATGLCAIKSTSSEQTNSRGSRTSISNSILSVKQLSSNMDSGHVSNTKLSMATLKAGTMIDLPRNSDSESDSDEEFNTLFLSPPFKSLQHKATKNQGINANKTASNLQVHEISCRGEIGYQNTQKINVTKTKASIDQSNVIVRNDLNLSLSTSYNLESPVQKNPGGNGTVQKASKIQEEVILLSSDDENGRENTSKSPAKEIMDVDSDDDSIFKSPPLLKSKKRSIPQSCEKISERNQKKGYGNNHNPHSALNDLLSPEPTIRHRPKSINVSSSVSDLGTNLTPSKKVPTPSLPQIDVAKLGGKLYHDHRHEFIKALILHANRIRNVKHQKAGLDTCVQAIVNLSLYPFPVRTAHAASSINGVGGTFAAILTDAEEKCKGQPYKPSSNKFSAVAPAAILSLYEYESQCNTEEVLCPMEELLNRINQKVDNMKKKTSQIFPKDVNYYLDKDNIDPGWMQIQKLCNENVRADRDQLVKMKKRKKLCNSGTVFELQDEGRKFATRLLTALNSPPEPPGPLRQLASDTVDDVYGNVTVSMDFREGGGGSRRLHDMCNFLDQRRIPYVVRNLKISDYVFFVKEKLAPVLIERKSIEDLAQSISDGRWKNQQHSMRKAQYVLGGGAARRCQLCYLIEGEINSAKVHGGYIGRRAWNIKVEDIEAAITELPSLGFSVMRTKTKMGSLDKVSKVARDVLWKARNGSIDCTYSYDDFIAAVKRLGNDKGNPPTEREHQNPAPPIAESMTPLGRHPIRQGPTTENEDCEDEMTGQNNLLSDAQNEKIAELNKHTIAKLKELCKERDEKHSGSKKDLITRLMQKRKPEILISRARQGQYVPKLPSCNAAILVAILLHNEVGDSMKKEDIMNYAEETGISKDPMHGNGKSFYNGWSGIKDLTGGDPPLISVVKRKYALTTQPHGAAGVDVARAIHIMAHRLNLCKCGTHIPT